MVRKDQNLFGLEELQTKYIKREIIIIQSFLSTNYSSNSLLRTDWALVDWARAAA